MSSTTMIKTAMIASALLLATQADAGGRQRSHSGPRGNHSVAVQGAQGEGFHRQSQTAGVNGGSSTSSLDAGGGSGYSRHKSTTTAAGGSRSLDASGGTGEGYSRNLSRTSANGSSHSGQITAADGNYSRNSSTVGVNGGSRSVTASGNRTDGYSKTVTATSPAGVTSSTQRTITPKP